jgi:hypothetical protein
MTINFAHVLLHIDRASPSVMSRRSKASTAAPAVLHLTVSGPAESEFEESQSVVVTSNASFGRSLDNTITTRDALVSRHHLELSEVNGKFYVQDVGSTTGKISRYISLSYMFVRRYFCLSSRQQPLPALQRCDHQDGKHRGYW